MKANKRGNSQSATTVSEFTTTASLGMNLPPELTEQETEKELTLEEQELPEVKAIKVESADSLVLVQVKTNTKIYVGNRWWYLSASSPQTVPKSVKDILFVQGALNPI